MLGSLLLYLKGMRIVMFQLSGFYCRQEQPRSSLPEGHEDSWLPASLMWVVVKIRVPFWVP